jgi:Holliday junction resolvase RusA-like endonuclease
MDIIFCNGSHSTSKGSIELLARLQCKQARSSILPFSISSNSSYLLQNTKLQDTMPPTRRRQGVVRVDSLMADETLYLRLWGEPIAQPRPRARLGAHGGRIIVYDPSTRFKAAAQLLVGAALDEIGVRDRPVFTSGRSVKVTAKYYTTDMRKDVDNLLKFTMDILQGPICNDDRYVIEVRAEKHHEPLAAQGRTDVEVEYI